MWLPGPTAPCYYYFALANVSNNILFQIFVAITEPADMPFHISPSLPSLNANYANLTLTLSLDYVEDGRRRCCCCRQRTVNGLRDGAVTPP